MRMVSVFHCSCCRQQRAVCAKEPSSPGRELMVGKSRADRSPSSLGQNPSAAAGPYPLPQPMHAQRTLHPQSPPSWVLGVLTTWFNSEPGSHPRVPCRTQENTGRGPRCPPPPSPAPHAPHCPRRSGLKRGLLPLVGGGALGLRRAPGPPAVRAGLPSRGGAHFPGPGGDAGSAVLSRAKPRTSQRPVSPALQRLTQHGLVVANPSEPSTSSTTRGRTLADRVPSTLVASKRKKKRASEISAIHTGSEESCSQQQGTRKGPLGPLGPRGPREA